MKRVFADTSYYIALVGQHDQHHADAVALAEAFRGQVVTADFVLLEVGNCLPRTGPLLTSYPRFWKDWEPKKRARSLSRYGERTDRLHPI